jgi:NodT family efflux transporter outer membrane factor (OMF) lipoprotein
LNNQLLIIFIINTLWLSGCTLGPDFVSPDTPNTSRYTAETLPTSVGKQTLQFGKEMPAQWWMLFRSSQLSTLISKALQHSPDLQAALATLTQANELAKAKQSAFFPSVDAEFSARRQQISGAQFGNPNMSGTLFSVYNASVKVSYTLDVFGSIQRQLEGLLAEADYQRFQLEGAFLTLSSNIATTAIEEAALREQISATEALINAEVEQLAIVKQQLALGGATQVELLAQQTAVEQQRANLPPLQKQLQQTRHRLTVLIGDLPSNQLPEQFNWSDLQLPLQLPVSLPSKLVAQRPDIRAQQALLHVASAKIGVVQAKSFPDFTVSANAGSIATHIGQLFIPGSAIWSLGSNIVQPLFHAGQNLHEYRAALAAYDAAAAHYQSTVLQALQNVADVLIALQADADTVSAQTTAEQTALASWQLIRTQYQVGAVNYLSLLNAQNAYQQARIGLIKAKAIQLTDSAALFSALGGGWWQRADLARELAAQPHKHHPSLFPFLDWKFSD